MRNFCMSVVKFVGDRTQIFGYRIESDGTLVPLVLSSLVAPFCCHQGASSGTVLYLADFGGGIAAMRADAQSGQLSPLPGSPFLGLTGSATGSPTACGNKFLYGQPVVDPSCSFLFVTNSFDGSSAANGGIVYAYTLDAATGILNSVSGSPFTVGNPTSIIRSATTDPTGCFLYVPNSDVQAVSGFSNRSHWRPDSLDRFTLYSRTESTFFPSRECCLQTIFVRCQCRFE